jgi:hypothetical protein
VLLPKLIKMKLFQYLITSIKPLRVRTPTGDEGFSGPVTHDCSKVYVVSTGGKIVYVGSTKQPLRRRLYGALNAEGQNGYYGYAWKHSSDPLDLDVWIFDEVAVEKGKRCMVAETVEAEIVFLVRQRDGNWPRHQTEIHFHPSSEQHRKWAEKIYGEAYRKTKPKLPLNS